MDHGRIASLFGGKSTAAGVIARVDLVGRSGVVTGDSSGIGAETARAVAIANTLVAALLRWFQLGCGLLRAALRLSILGLVIATALAHAAILRLTIAPVATVLARSRAAWFHRWSVLVCAVLGLQIEREGFSPVSGLVVINHMTLINALLLSSVAPFVFVVDLDLRRRPIVGLSGAPCGGARSVNAGGLAT